MSGTLYVGTFKVDKPTFTIQPYDTGPVAELYLGGGPFVEYADVDGLSDLIAAAMDARASLAEAQAGEATETRAEFVGVVRDPVLDPDCRDGKHTSCAGGPCECDCHAPPLPKRVPGGPPATHDPQTCTDGDHYGQCSGVTGPPAWQAAMNAELSEQALAAEVPLVSLAPEPQEDEEARS